MTTKEGPTGGDVAAIRRPLEQFRMAAVSLLARHLPQLESEEMEARAQAIRAKLAE